MESHDRYRFPFPSSSEPRFRPRRPLELTVYDISACSIGHTIASNQRYSRRQCRRIILDNVASVHAKITGNCLKRTKRRHHRSCSVHA